MRNVLLGIPFPYQVVSQWNNTHNTEVVLFLKPALLSLAGEHDM